MHVMLITIGMPTKPCIASLAYYSLYLIIVLQYRLDTDYKRKLYCPKHDGAISRTSISLCAIMYINFANWVTIRDGMIIISSLIMIEIIMKCYCMMIVKMVIVTSKDSIKAT